jgi:hypothetical protein
MYKQFHLQYKVGSYCFPCLLCISFWEEEGEGLSKFCTESNGQDF